MTLRRLLPGEFDYLLGKVQQGRSGTRDALVLTMLHDSAMRIDDALTVKLDHFSADRSLVQIHDGKWRKGSGAVDTLPVSQRTIDLLDAYLPTRHPRTDGPLIVSANGSMMHQQHYRRLLAREGQRWLGKHVYPHLLRHTMLSEAALGIRGVKPAMPLPLVQKLARHKDVKSTMVYVHADEAWTDDVREWMAG